MQVQILITRLDGTTEPAAICDGCGSLDLRPEPEEQGWIRQKDGGDDETRGRLLFCPSCQGLDD